MNDCINDSVYDGVTFTLKYPTVDQIVHKIQELDSDVLLSKLTLVVRSEILESTPWITTP